MWLKNNNFIDGEIFKSHVTQRSVKKNHKSSEPKERKYNVA